MKQQNRFWQKIFSFLFSLFSPVIFVASGAGVAALGINFGWPVLIWTGLIIVGAGIVLGILIYSGEGNLFGDD